MRPALPARVLALLLGFSAAAAGGPLPDDQVKAAVIYKVMLFTQWQPESEAADRRVLCIRGRDGVAEALPALAGRTLGARALQVRTLSDESLDGCDAVYLASGATRPIPTESLRRPGLMTVVDCGLELCASGAVLSLAVENGRLVFSVDRGQAEAQGLAFSAQVLRLARPGRGS